MGDPVKPIANLLADHVQIWSALESIEAALAESERMRAALAAVRAGNEAAWFQVADAFARYSAIIRVHLPKENLGFFPMSDRALPAPVQAELGQRFAEIDGALPMTFAGAVQELKQRQPGPAGRNAPPAPPRKAPHKFSDRFLLYDRKMVAAMAALDDDARRKP